MAVQFANVPTGGGTFFKPAEHADAKALLVEVSRFEHQRPGNYGPKDTAVANVTAFKTEADFTGSPDVAEGAFIQNTILARDLEGLVGKATVVKLEQVPSKKAGNNPAWVWRAVEADVMQKVGAYVEKSEADLAAAMDEAPSFG